MRSNPFSTKFTRPGAIPYFFPEDMNTGLLAKRFLNLGSKRGLIVGQHGTGKSTLIAMLVDELRLNFPAHCTKIDLIRFSSDTANWKIIRNQLCLCERRQILILDGLEQLNCFSRSIVKTFCSMLAISLLATSHSPLRGFETIWNTHVDSEVAEKVVRHLLTDLSTASPESLLASKNWILSRTKHRQNLRETLFDMYDWWHETHTRSGALSS